MSVPHAGILARRFSLFMRSLVTLCASRLFRGLCEKRHSHQLFSCGLSFWHDMPFILLCFQNMCMQISREHSKCGFKIDSRQIQSILVRLCFLFSPPQNKKLLYEKMNGGQRRKRRVSHTRARSCWGISCFWAGQLKRSVWEKCQNHFECTPREQNRSPAWQGPHLADVPLVSGVAWFLWSTHYFPSDQQWVATHPGRLRVGREDLRAWFSSNTLKPVEEMAHTSASVM